MLFDADTSGLWGGARLGITRTRAVDGSLRLGLVGELDLSSTDALAGALDASRGESTVVLDLSQLEFADLSGLGCVLEWLQRSRREGWTLDVDPQLSPQVARLVALTDARSLLWPRSTRPRSGIEQPEIG